MKNKIKLVIVLIICLCFSNFIADAASKDAPESPNVSVYLDYIPYRVKPGDMPIDFNKSLLNKLVPELKNPRLMTLKDLDEAFDEPHVFLSRGYSFVLRDDFNSDGIADIVFVGKYDNLEKPDKNCFIAVVSIKDKSVIREYFSRIYSNRISLLRVIAYKPKMDAIGMTFNLVSDDCAYLFWTGKKWQVETCRSDFSNQ